MEEWFRAAKNNDIAYIKTYYHHLKGMRTKNGGYTALMIAARHGCREVVTFLKDHEAKIYCDTHWTALMFACDVGYQPIVCELAPLEAGLSDYRGLTGLMRASIHGFSTIVKELITYDSELNATLIEPAGDFPIGSNALSMAMMAGNKDLVYMLLPYEVSSTTTDLIQECTRVHELSEAQVECVSLVKRYLTQRDLIENPTFKSSHPWFYAAATNDISYIQEHLFEFATTMNPDDNNKCALFYAILYGAQDAINLLFEREKDCVDIFQNEFTSYLKDTIFKNVVVGSPMGTQSTVSAKPESTAGIADQKTVNDRPKCPASTATLLRGTPRLTLPNSKAIPVRATTTRSTPQEARRPKARGANSVSPNPSRSRSNEKNLASKGLADVHTVANSAAAKSKINTTVMPINSRALSACRSAAWKTAAQRRSFSRPITPPSNRNRLISGGSKFPVISRIVESSIASVAAGDIKPANQEILSVITSDTCCTISEHTEENLQMRSLSMPCISISVAQEEVEATEIMATDAAELPYNEDCFKLLVRCNNPSYTKSTDITPGATTRPSKYSPRSDGSLEQAEKSLSNLLISISDKVEKLDIATRQNTEQYSSLESRFEMITTLITSHNKQIENILKTQQALVEFMLQEKSNRDQSDGGYSTTTPTSVVIGHGSSSCSSVPLRNIENEVVTRFDANMCSKQESISTSICRDAPRQLPILSPNESSLYDQTRFVTKSIRPSTFSTIYMGPVCENTASMSESKPELKSSTEEIPLPLCATAPQQSVVFKPGFCSLISSTIRTSVGGMKACLNPCSWGKNVLCWCMAEDAHHCFYLAAFVLGCLTSVCATLDVINKFFQFSLD